MTGAEFRRRRERLRLSREDIALLFGVAVRTIGNWERDVSGAPPISKYAFDAWDGIANAEMWQLLARAKKAGRR